ncbi:VRR-NUC domain-containing protein [Marinilongibacter aquaticus]|uniref:VRR-NUC domain-containing protein n=1 Tax=Marinilongibacter aquaticus TaxID=2975157 RepID=UPI0021BD2E0B|nr:VRR-NUC domain-containing protein [Marinilongibacter aquaticus]UBM58338.1 VRR-NUC domain-containing protein [Marinilongibacter aquaticus]
MSENQNLVLPPKYYLDYFNYLLDFVKDKYKHILQENEWRFLRKFYGLSEDAQCLFIRFTNRKGLFFRTKKLEYEELSEIKDLLEELSQKEFVEWLNPAHAPFVHDLLLVNTKAELLKIPSEKAAKSIQKDELIEHIRLTEKPEFIVSQIASQQEWVKVNFEFETAFLKFLFFGNRYMDMTEFVVRDLGFVQYFQHDDDKLVARFETRKDAEDKWMLSDQAELFEQLKKTEEPEDIFDWFMTLNSSLHTLSEVAKPSLERLKYKIGRHLERTKNLELAVEIYNICTLPAASERHIRSLNKLGKNAEALALCQDLMAHSHNADEVFFAKDFSERIIQKSPRRKKLTTEKLHQSEQITIPSEFRGQVELGTIAHFISQGQMAIFSENYLWRGLFGLIFWDIIFDPSLVAFHHPFQRRPSDLHLPDFYEKRKESIHAHLDTFEDTDELLVFMREKYVANEGIANPFVLWLDELWDGIRIATQFIGLDKLKGILVHMSKDIAENSRGFPDLFVWDEENYAFVEVKSPTDNLSNRQLFWLGYFEENGINAHVLRVFFQ